MTTPTRRRWFNRTTTPDDRRVDRRSLYRPRLERLEDRLAPATVGYQPLANDLTFYGSYTQTATGYTFDSSQPVEIGLYDGGNHDNFKAVLQVVNGDVTFATEDNDQGDFTFDGSLQTVPAGTVQPVTLLSGNGQQLTAANLVNNNFTTVAGGAGATIPLGFAKVVINSISLGTDPAQGNAAAILVHGEIDIPLPGSGGGNEQGGENNNQIAVGVQGTDTLYLYLTPAGGFGVDISGASISITDSFSWNGVTIAPQGLTLDVSAGGGGTFSIYGSVQITTASADTANNDPNFAVNVTVQDGGPSNPGFQFTNWQLTNFDFTANGGITFGGFKVQAQDLHVNYSADDDTFIVDGGLSLRLEAATFTVSLTGPSNPDGDTAGLIVKDGVPQFDGLTLAMSDFDLGVFKINNLSVAFSYSGSSFSVASSAGISLPGNWGIGGNFQFTYYNQDGFVLNAIGAYITGEVPIGTTGLFLTSIRGSLSNLGTQNWSIAGSLGIAFGETVTIQGHPCRIVAATGGFSLDRNELKLGGSVGFGTFGTNKDGSFQTLFGVLNGDIDLDWADGVYSAEVNGSFLDGTFTVNATFRLSDTANELSILCEASADLNVPNAVPLIGGDHLLGGTFMFQYQQTDTGGGGSDADGFFAAWVSLPLIGNVGFEIDVETGDFSLLGNSQIKNLQAGFNQQQQFYVYTNTFTVPPVSQPVTPPEGAEVFNFIAQWPPLTSDNNSQLLLTNSQGVNVGQSYTPGLSAPPGQRILGVQVNDAPNPVPPGTYTLSLKTTDQLDPASIVWTMLAGYGVPNAVAPLNVSVSGGILTATIEVALDSAFAAQAQAALYADTDNAGYNGVRVATTTDFSNSPSSGFYNLTFTVDLATLAPPPGTYYFYVVLNDGFDTPNTTPYSTQPNVLAAQPACTATLTETGDGRNRPLAGFTVYMDANGNNQYDSGEPTCITNAAGQYWFYGPGPGQSFVANHLYLIGVVAPPGYQLPTGQLPTEPFVLGDAPIAAPFLRLEQPTSIEGQVVYTNVKNNLPAAAVTVYLDQNNNGQLDAGEPTTNTLTDGSYAFIGLAESTAYTVRYVVPAGALAAPGTPAFASVTTDTDPFALYTVPAFNLVQEATITGMVTGYPTSGGNGPVPQTGWTVQLRAGGSTVATTTTNANGVYTFSNLTPGTYTVQEQPPTGWRQTAPIATQPNLAAAFQALGKPVQSLVSADFNNDKKLDLAAYVSGPGSVVYARGNGDGTFATPQVVLSGLSVDDLQAGDFNGDGVQDLLALMNASFVAVFCGGAGGFGSPKVLYTTPGPVLMGIAAGGDFDGDGSDDFAAFFEAKSMEPLVDYYYAVQPVGSAKSFQGGATLTMQPSSFSPLPRVSGRAVSFGDFNKDDNLDLLIDLGNSVGVAYGHGDGTFGVTGTGVLFGLGPDLPIEVLATGGPVAVGDLNGDGLPDLVTSDFVPAGYPLPLGKTDLVYILQQTSAANWVGPDGKFASSKTPGLSPDPSGTGRTFDIPRSAIADVDGDGRPDVVLVERPLDGGSGQLLVLFNQGVTNGLAGFDTNPGHYFVVPLAAGSAPNSLALGDFTGDGLLDAVLGDATYKVSGAAGGVWMLSNTTQITTAATVNASGGLSEVDFTNLQTGQVAGAVYGDANADARRGASEPGLPGVTVYLDTNGDGAYQPGEPYTVTNAAGLYAFTGLAPGQTARLRLLNGLVPDQVPGPKEGYALTVSQGSPNFDFAVHPRLLQAIADAAVGPGRPLKLTVHRLPPRDRVSRPQGRLVFTLEPGAPAGMAINPATGVLTWTPPAGLAPGAYPVTVSLSDPTDPRRAGSETFTVTVQSPGPALTAYEFTPLAQTPVATFRLPDNPPAGQVSATINWGDGTAPTSGAVSLAGGVYTVRGSHTYTDEGTYGVTVTVSGGGTTTGFTTTANVLEELLPGGGRGTPNQRFLSEVYRDLLGRAIDPSGLASWGQLLDAGASRTAVVRAIENGTEFRSREVDQLYRQYLHRAADPAGLNSWAGLLRLGRTVEQLAAAFVQSPEYQQRRTDGTFYGWLDAFYADALGRAVDPGGRAHWDAAARAGATRQQVALAVFTAGPLPGQAANEYQFDVVNYFYEHLLGRTSRTDPGAASWAAALQRGARDEDVLAAIAGGTEYFNKTAL